MQLIQLLCLEGKIRNSLQFNSFYGFGDRGTLNLFVGSLLQVHFYTILMAYSHCTNLGPGLEKQESMGRSSPVKCEKNYMGPPYKTQVDQKMKLHEKCSLKQRVLYSNSRLLQNIPLDNYYYMYKRVNVYSWITHHTTGHILLFLWHLGYMSRSSGFLSKSIMFRYQVI